MVQSPAPDDPPVALTVAGSDAGGGAGVQADLPTMAARGVHGTSAVTAVTAQHTRGVESTHVLPVAEVDAQLAAVRDDFDLRAGKTGMLATAAIVERVTEHVRAVDWPVVVDPVMVAESGDRLLDADAEAAYGDLVAAARLVTPNAAEAEVLTGVAVEDRASAERAARDLCSMGADAALVTGGHVAGDEVVDVLVADGEATAFAHERVATAATHGSGCTLTAGIAARLARGDGLREAVADESAAMARAVRHHVDVGQGPGAVQGAVELRDRAARDTTAEAVRSVVDALVAADVRALVPEVGLNVAGATPFAAGPEDCAAVEGRVTRTVDGVAPSGGVRFGASDHLARFLVAARDHHPSLRFCCNCRHDDATRDALAALDWVVASYDRREQPPAVREAEGETMPWAADAALADRERPPVAVTDPGAHGKEPMCKLLARDAPTLRDRVLALADARDP
jgi:hydroxymethylpyrimidine kinase/phosphomethylpyrimidine kinase